jgi:hypothetical protein
MDQQYSRKAALIRNDSFALLVLSAILIAACSGNPGGSQAQACREGVSTAYKELNLADTEGFGGTVEYTKAAGLLTAAKVQYEFEKYPNCIDKVGRARAYIRRSKGG